MTIILIRIMEKQMNEVLQQEGGDVPYVDQGGQFTQWIGKALLLYIWQSDMRLESLKEEN
jgi:hypothetical protein